VPKQAQNYREDRGVEVTIDVKDRAEGERLKVALQDETVRACVNVMVVLLPLPTHARNRVLAFVANQLHEDACAPDVSAVLKGQRPFVI
jgi:hypothetical protein